MFLSRSLRGNLNTRHWNRRAWEVGYRGPLLPQQKATGRPDLPVSQDRVTILRERLQRELGVMKMLTKPYVTKEVEESYFASQNVANLEEIRERETEEMEARRMPGKPKRTEGSKVSVRRRGNVGNLLHEHSTVEDSLKELMRRSRWD